MEEMPQRYPISVKPCTIPQDKADIALCTAWAGEMLGLKTIYMDAGSGAKNPISETLIAKVSSQIHVPLIIGGGIKTAEKIEANCRAWRYYQCSRQCHRKKPFLNYRNGTSYQRG